MKRKSFHWEVAVYDYYEVAEIDPHISIMRSKGWHIEEQYITKDGNGKTMTVIHYKRVIK